MTEPTISDLNAAYAELEHWVAQHLSTHGGSVRVSVENIRICPGFTGEVKGCGATLSAAIYAALEQLRVVLATVPPVPRDAAAKDDRPSEEIIREDRDAWPDRQAHDPIRAAAKEGEP